MSESEDLIPAAEAVRSLEWMGQRLAAVKRERDQYRRWFDRLAAATAHYIESVQEQSAADADALAGLRDELDRIKNGLTRKRQLEAAALAAEAIRRYEAGELVKNIAKDLGRKPRWVWQVVPDEMKTRMQHRG